MMKQHWKAVLCNGISDNDSHVTAGNARHVSVERNFITGQIRNVLHTQIEGYIVVAAIKIATTIVWAQLDCLNGPMGMAGGSHACIMRPLGHFMSPRR